MHALLLWRAGEHQRWARSIAFMGLMGTLRFPTFISIFSFNLVQMGVAGAERILETDQHRDRAGRERRRRAPTPIRGEVVFERRQLRLRRQRRCCKDISFARPAGRDDRHRRADRLRQDTLTRLINRIFDADSGRVLVDGVDVRDWSLESLRSQISTIEQDVFLFSRTLAENIAFGCADATPGDDRASRRAKPRRTSSSPASARATTPRSASAA